MRVRVTKGQWCGEEETTCEGFSDCPQVMVWSSERDVVAVDRRGRDRVIWKCELGGERRRKKGRVVVARF